MAKENASIVANGIAEPQKPKSMTNRDMLSLKAELAKDSHDHVMPLSEVYSA